MRMDRRLCFSPNSMHIWNKYNITWTNRGSLGDWITAGSTITGLAPEGIYVNGTRISKSTTIYRSDLLSNMPNYNSSYSVSSNGFIELSGDVTSSSEVYTSCNNIIARKIGSSSINYRVFSGGIWYWKKYKGIINGYIASPSSDYTYELGSYYEDGNQYSSDDPFDADANGYDYRDVEYYTTSEDELGSGNYHVRLTMHYYTSDSITSVNEYGITLGGEVGSVQSAKYAHEIDSKTYWETMDSIDEEVEQSGRDYNEVYAEYTSSWASGYNCYESNGDVANPLFRVIVPTPTRKKGSYIGLVSSDNQNKYPKDGYTNFDEYYYEFDHYGDAVKGTTYLGQVKDKNENAYPDNGLYNGYWYVKVK